MSASRYFRQCNAFLSSNRAGSTKKRKMSSSSANKRIANSTAADLAYFLQEKELCEEYVAWYDEMPPMQRLLRKNEV